MNNMFFVRRLGDIFLGGVNKGVVKQLEQAKKRPKVTFAKNKVA